MSSPDWQSIAKELGTSDKERLAIWMIQHGLATGHGETLDDLLHELSWQIKAKDAEIERQKKAIRKLEECNEYLLGRVLENNQLISELCDALVESGFYCGQGSLIQRAREATR
jgi:hypothetical protein